MQWKTMFLIGAIPAFLCVLIQMRLKEPEKWSCGTGRGPQDRGGVRVVRLIVRRESLAKAGSLGMILCVSGVIGLGESGFSA
jgi:hypothetical protein